MIIIYTNETRNSGNLFPCSRTLSYQDFLPILVGLLTAFRQICIVSLLPICISKDKEIIS